MSAQSILQSISNVILSATLRIYILRMLLGSSLACLLATPFADLRYIEDIITVIPLSLVVLVHHVLRYPALPAIVQATHPGDLPSVFIFRWLPTFGDLFLTIVECTFVILFIRPWSWYFGWFDLPAFMILTCAIYLQSVTLSIMLLFRIVSASSNGVDALFKPFDFLAVSRGSDSKTRDRKSLVGGYSVWRTFFTNEPRTITVLRGVFAISTLGGLLAFLINNIILDPVSETGRAPQKMYRAEDINNDFVLERDVHWKILAFITGYEAYDYDSALSLRDAVKVEPLWDILQDDFNRPCTSKPDEQLLVPGDIYDPRSALYPSIYVIEFRCPDRLNITNRDEYTAYNYMQENSADVWPDLLITVNFTQLGMNASTLANYRSRTVSIVVGLTENTDDVISNTSPIPMVPDLHVFGGVIPTIRQQFKKADFASFGLFSDTKKFLLGRVPLLLPDPSSLIPRENNTATLRLYMQSDYADWIFMVDYREKSVWAGLSAVGGFWTALNGVFVFIFGTSLLMILFDVKPLSNFGLIHKFKIVRLDEYPQLMTEGQGDPGLVAYMRDHFIDLGPLQEQQDSGKDHESDETEVERQHLDTASDSENGKEASPLMA